jgi:hypothetical protein
MKLLNLFPGPMVLYRIRDGAGDQGCSVVSLGMEDGEIKHLHYQIQVGYSIQIGSITARSYCYQDYWTTTPVTKILKQVETSLNIEGENKTFSTFVRFLTGNSEYVLYSPTLTESEFLEAMKV